MAGEDRFRLIAAWLAKAPRCGRSSKRRTSSARAHAWSWTRICGVSPQTGFDISSSRYWKNSITSRRCIRATKWDGTITNNVACQFNAIALRQAHPPAHRRRLRAVEKYHPHLSHTKRLDDGCRPFRHRYLDDHPGHRKRLPGMPSQSRRETPRSERSRRGSRPHVPPSRLTLFTLMEQHALVWKDVRGSRADRKLRFNGIS